MEKKIKNLTQLKRIVSSLKAKGKRVVFTNGCFDLLHYGHVKYLQDARSRGNVLVVAVNSDASVRKIKGRKRPVIGQNDRLRIIAALESVDYVILFKEETPLKLIKALKPDILVKGADWNKKHIVGRGTVLSHGGRVCNIKFVKGRSSTSLIKKIAKSF